MNQSNLFGYDYKGIPVERKTCRECNHRQRWQKGGRVIQYCKAIKSNRTENGLLKIRCKDISCDLFNAELKDI